MKNANTIDQTQPVLCRHIDGAQLRNATEDELGNSIEAGEQELREICAIDRADHAR